MKLFPDIKITVEGHKYLGSFIGSDEGKQTFVENEVNEWISDIYTLYKLLLKLESQNLNWHTQHMCMDCQRNGPSFAEQPLVLPHK